MAKVVAICGAHGTGKSTLVEELRKDPRCECVGSVTRTNTTQAERRIDGTQDLDEAQLQILTAIQGKVHDLKQLKQVLEDDKILVLDRSAIDFYAYSKNFWIKGLITDKTFSRIERQIWDLTNFIDRFYYLPIEFSIQDDGVRSLDVDLQHKVDTVIREQLFKCGRTVELTGTVQQRLDKLNQTLWQ